MTARIQTLPCGSRSNASNRAPSAPTYQRAARDATIVVSGYTAAVLADTDLTFRRHEWIVDCRRSTLSVSMEASRPSARQRDRHHDEHEVHGTRRDDEDVEYLVKPEDSRPQSRPSQRIDDR